ncbi:MAG: RIP metalloprotease RseP [Paludibacteraceae bacterium]|nr:RIP metalloprotease RseP [Paludibacteraceae bacterium]
MDILIRILQLIASLCFLVLIHELGHFTFARLFGVRVEKFYMFFNYKCSIVRAKKINGKWQIKWFAKNVEEPTVTVTDENGNTLKDENDNDLLRPMTAKELNALPVDDWRRYPETTEWGIGWIPLGGYCSICGMVDETKDVNQLGDVAQPWEYRSQSIWKRMLIITGGVMFNLIGAMVIYGAMLSHWGEQYVPMANADYGEQFSEIMLKHGFENGDKIVAVNGVMPLTIKETINKILIDEEHNITVVRNGDTLDIILPDDFTNQVIADNASGLIDFRFPFVCADLLEGGNASQGGMIKGDSVIALDGNAMFAFQDVSQYIHQHASDTIEFTVVRASDTLALNILASDEGTIGVYPVTPDNYLVTETKQYGFFSAIPAGIEKGWETLVNYVKQMKYLFSSEGVKQVGGFGTIGKLFPPHWDWFAFWSMTAFLSVILAFMNILPIPVLDGGYLLFLLYELITRRKPSDKFLERASTIGFILLLALMIYANLNDILKLFF